ncbi:TetR/AcrR family transcriptional regulator [Mycolicibacterium neworleansense]|uniref:Transcriptional regulator n=1 Tax=Mycolicibacterium neworleansense TaxID=146018 RepID=A0A0H5RLQ5_9MYCO|nr:TetR/AcrR family transcriptional regulator [Mycolicibacterium neworleansense]MCV7363951.1 TetR/AcrR family transcriptional regulator [Mycolicibacterium neworleansense]CRZ14711.1 transcriptional regulator [Mycolicibacterium neworleansense]
MRDADRTVSPALLAATSETLRRLGPRQFSLTAVAEHAGVSRGTVHNALGSRDNAIRVGLDHLAGAFIETIAAEVGRHDTLADQVAAAAVVICAHRRQSGSVAPRGINESILVLLLRNTGDDLMRRSIDLWKPFVRTAQERGEVGAGIAPARASEWIVRLLLSFELLPPIGVNLDSPRAVKRFVSDHIVVGLTGRQ